MPARQQRAGLRLTVADDADDEQLGVVERGAVGVHERVAEFAALVDRAGRLRRDVARHAAGERELPEELAQAFLVTADVRVDLGVRPSRYVLATSAGTPWLGPVTKIASRSRALIARFRCA